MRIWQLRGHSLPLGEKTYVMGIVNATPDSFSGDGLLDPHLLTEAALKMVAEGADILDIGGESSRPGAAAVTERDELHRVVPLVRMLVSQTDVPISIDTTKSAVARAALQAGAHIVNDISAGLADSSMLPAIARSGCGFVMMHRRGTSATMGWSMATAGGRPTDAGSGGAIMAELGHYFEWRIRSTDVAGISRNQLCLDGGFGFGKSYDENLEILRSGRALAAHQLATMSATSRKSTIGRALGEVAVDDREWGTAAAVALAIAGGCDIVRVHNVKAMRDVARMADAVVRGRNSATISSV